MQILLLARFSNLAILRAVDVETSKEVEHAEESGTGFPPVTEIKKRRGAYPPHWTRDGGWYAVTFRLWDSLPQHVIETWLFERKNIVKNRGVDETPTK